MSNLTASHRPSSQKIDRFFAKIFFEKIKKMNGLPWLKIKKID